MIAVPHARRRRTLAGRVFVTAIGVFAIATQLAAVAHLAAARHVACAEHGELIELAPDAVVITANAKLPSVERAEAGHGHDHCALAAVRRSHATFEHTPSAQRVDTMQPARAAGVSLAIPPSSIALLAFAPKSSPPV